MADYTTVGLLANIRRRAMLPATTTNGTADADLLALANDELWLNVAANLLGVREDYLTTYSDVAISGSEYRIPSRAVAQTLRLVQLRDSSGNARDLTRLQPGDATLYANTTGDVFGFYVRGNSIVLVPASTPTAYTTLRFVYPRRPSELTATSTDYGTISAINTGTGVVTFTGAGVFSGLGPIDFVCGTPGFDVMAADITPTSATASSVTVAAASLPAGLAVGDYVCIAGKSPVPTVPLEFHSTLAILVAMDVCVALGDKDAASTLAAELEKAEKSSTDVLASPRTPGSPQKAVARFNALSGRRRIL